MRRVPKILGVCAALGICSCAALAQRTSKPAATGAKSSTSRAEPSRRFVQQFEQVALSPDGKTVAWVETQTDKQGGETGKHDIYVTAYEKDVAPRRISAGTAAAGLHFDEHDVSWSPDGKQLAFLSDAVKKRQLQLYVVNVTGGAPSKLTDAKGFLATPKWSPDERTVAVLYTENATREAGPLVAETPETGVIKDAFFEQRLALVDVASGKLRQITRRICTSTNTVGLQMGRASR